MTNIIHRRSRLLNLFIWGLVFIWIIAASFPFFWTLWGSFKVQGDFFSKADWTNALEKLILDVKLRKKLSKAGREKIKSDYSLKSQEGKYNKILI